MGEEQDGLLGLLDGGEDCRRGRGLDIAQGLIVFGDGRFLYGRAGVLDVFYGVVILAHSLQLQLFAGVGDVADGPARLGESRLNEGRRRVFYVGQVVPAALHGMEQQVFRRIVDELDSPRRIGDGRFFHLPRRVVDVLEGQAVGLDGEELHGVGRVFYAGDDVRVVSYHLHVFFSFHRTLPFLHIL